MPYRLLSGACAEPCGTTIVLIYYLEVKGEIVSNFIFQFVSPSFTSDIVQGFTGGVSHKDFVLVLSARNEGGI